MLAQTEDQELFEKTTAQFLDETFPSARVRELARRDDPFDAGAWKRGAALGWTSLLVPESAGGGSISGNGLLDLLLVAFQHGRHAAPGPLVGTNAVAFALGRWGSDRQRAETLPRLLDGTTTAAWCAARRGDGVAAAESRDRVVLDGTLPCVEAEAALLLVPAGDGALRSHWLVPASASGVDAAPLESLDATRRFRRLTLRSVELPTTARVGEAGAAAVQADALLDLVATLHAGEIAGAMERAFDMTLEWTADRYSFGRPLASYQEIKHRVADLRTALEATAAIAAKAARAIGDGRPDASAWAGAAKAWAGRVGPEAIQDCIQLHGGIGVTFDHDLHLLLRRAAADAQLFGTPADFRDRLVRQIETGSGR